jgi:hypothetical protein
MEDVGIFYGHLVHFTVFCYISRTSGKVRGNLVHFSRFGILHQEKSGNPVRHRGSGRTEKFYKQFFFPRPISTLEKQNDVSKKRHFLQRLLDARRQLEERHFGGKNKVFENVEKAGLPNDTWKKNIAAGGFRLSFCELSLFALSGKCIEI